MADDLQYKVYILEGQETVLTETKEYALKKEYQFPDSLIDFLYVDFKPLMGAFEQLGRDIENLYQKKDVQYTRNVLASMLKLWCNISYCQYSNEETWNLRSLWGTGSSS